MREIHAKGVIFTHSGIWRPARKSCRVADFRVNFRAMNLAECLKQQEGKTLEFLLLETVDERPMPESDSEALDFRAASESFARLIGRTSRAARTRLARLVQRGLVVEIGTGPRDPLRKYHLAKH